MDEMTAGTLDAYSVGLKVALKVLQKAAKKVALKAEN